MELTTSRMLVSRVRAQDAGGGRCGSINDHSSSVVSSCIAQPIALILGARDFSPGHEMIPRCLRKHERIEATEIAQQIFWPTRVNQAALGQRTEMTRKTVPHSFRVSLSGGFD